MPLAFDFTLRPYNTAVSNCLKDQRAAHQAALVRKHFITPQLPVTNHCSLTTVHCLLPASPGPADVIGQRHLISVRNMKTAAPTVSLVSFVLYFTPMKNSTTSVP